MFAEESVATLDQQNERGAVHPLENPKYSSTKNLVRCVKPSTSRRAVKEAEDSERWKGGSHEVIEVARDPNPQLNIRDPRQIQRLLKAAAGSQPTRNLEVLPVAFVSAGAELALLYSASIDPNPL